MTQFTFMDTLKIPKTKPINKEMRICVIKLTSVLVENPMECFNSPFIVLTGILTKYKKIFIKLGILVKI